MNRLILALAALLALAPASAHAQSAPGWISYGYTPTAGQFRAAFAAKQDLLNYTPLSQTGGTMSGKLNTAPATVNGSGFAFLPGVAPTSPANGDAWVTSTGFFVRVNGQTSAVLPVGTTAGTVAAGNDSRIIGALQASTAATTYAPLASPAFTGTPTAPTPAVGTNTTQVATAAMVTAAVSGGGAAAVLYTPQSLTSGQQDQARANVSGAVSSAPSTSTTLGATDFERDLYPTGTITITAANGGAGWRSGIVTNDNAATGLVTLAVPSGATLDGTTNGTTILYPFQRARVRQTGATAYRTDWVDRSPLVATLTITSATATAGLNLPAGYSGFRVAVRGLTLSATGATLGYRLSATGSGGIKSGASDYSNITVSANGSAVGSTSGALSYGYLSSNQNDSAGAFPSSLMASLTPGATGQAATLVAMAFVRDNTPQLVSARYDSVYTGVTSGALGRANYIQLVPTTGTINQVFVDIYGEP